jgi:hypothetical protein
MASPSSNTTIDCDVIVVGGGNAGFCAAISAAQSGAGKVILIDKCPEEWAGGNSYFTAGAFRTVHHGLEDILPIANNVDSATAKIIDLAPYTRDDFLGDLSRVTHGRFDPDLGKELIDESNESIKWLARIGVRFQLSFNRQAYKIDGRFKFWGGMCLKTEDGGKGLILDHQRAAKRLGVTVLYSTAARNILLDPKSGAFRSLLATDEDGNSLLINAKAIILAGKCYHSRTGCLFLRNVCVSLTVKKKWCGFLLTKYSAGGFEANPRMRSQYLGPGWDLAYVRGTPYNTGECLEMAIRDISAKQIGQWSGCHSVAWDANAPANTGDREISNEFTKSGYPLGITINNQGVSDSGYFIFHIVCLTQFTGKIL